MNRIVDISSYIDHKVRGNVANKGKGPAGKPDRGSAAELAREGKKLPLLGDNDDTADFQYVKHFLMDDWKLLGERFGLQYAEAFRYIGPAASYRENIRKYVDQHAVPIGKETRHEQVRCVCQTCSCHCDGAR